MQFFIIIYLPSHLIWETLGSVVILQFGGSDVEMRG